MASMMPWILLFAPLASASATDALSEATVDEVDLAYDGPEDWSLPGLPRGNNEYKVVGGAPAPSGQWPDAAAIVMGGQVSCTGTLIAPDLVLTAAHCIGSIDSVILNAANYRDALLPEPQRLAQQIEIIGVTRQLAYPEWWSTIDVGILELERPSEFTQPRLIAQSCIADQYLEIGAPAAIVGYGMTQENGGGGTSYQHEATTTIELPACEQTVVRDIATGCNPSVAPGGELGAGGDGIDACFGDSGGPLYLITPIGDFLVGVTSRSYAGVSPNAPCRDGGIYGRPGAAVEWIERETGRELDRPYCSAPPVPSIEPVTARSGRKSRLHIDANDPDNKDHSYEIVEPPLHGTAEIVRGQVVYTSEPGYIGDDTFTVRVADNGHPDWPDAPPATADLEVPVSVVEGCGCSGAAPTGALAPWLLGATLLTRRRRTS